MQKSKKIGSMPEFDAWTALDHTEIESENALQKIKNALKMP